MHCIKYQVVVRISDGQIVWISGGVWGSIHDLTLLRQSRLLQKLLPGEHLYADKGYIGESLCLCPHKGRSADLNYHQLLWNQYLNPYRTRVENSLGRIHKFQCLNIPWRGDIHRHLNVFHICSQIAAIDIKFNPIFY